MKFQDSCENHLTKGLLLQKITWLNQIKTSESSNTKLL